MRTALLVSWGFGLALAAAGVACGDSAVPADDGGGGQGGGAGAGGGGGAGGGAGEDGGAGGGAGSDGGGGDAGGTGGGGGSMGGGDTTMPFPIDLGGTAGAPATYKMLPLGLAKSAEPTVTAVDGVIGVVCIGMSNGNQECMDFMAKLMAGTYKVNAQVKLVNCAVGGNAIERWNDPMYDAMLWDACIDTKLGMRGVKPEQVRVVWHKAADQFTTVMGMGVKPPYPDPGSDYFAFKDALGVFAKRLKEKLPSVQAVYTSSRSYGGFANSDSRGEPLSYEEGLALNAWLGENPMAEGIWQGWGPYLWAPDCATGKKNGSDVCYERADYQDDGVHPATGARDKISAMLDARLRQHAWYRP